MIDRCFVAYLVCEFDISCLADCEINVHRQCLEELDDICKNKKRGSKLITFTRKASNTNPNASKLFSHSIQIMYFFFISHKKT